MIMGLSPWPATHLKGHSLMSACTMGSANLRPIKRFASKTLGWLAHSSQNRNMKDSLWEIVQPVSVGNQAAVKKEAVLKNVNKTVSGHIIAQHCPTVGRDMCSLSWPIMIIRSRAMSKSSFTLQLPRMICKCCQTSGSVLRIACHLILGGITNKSLGVCKSHIRWSGSVAWSLAMISTPSFFHTPTQPGLSKTM